LILIVNFSLLILFIAYKSKQQPQQQQQSQSQSFPIIPEEEEDKTKRLFYNNNNNNNNNVKLPLRPFSRPKQQNATSQRQLASIRSFQNIHHNNLNLNNNNNNKACCLLQSPKQQTLSKKIDLSKIIIQHNLKPHQPQQQQQPPQQNERNIESPSTSAFTVDSTKKYLNDTRTQDDFNKERIHLLSAHLSYKPHTNTLLCSTIKRPMSNVNNGSNSNYDELLCSGFELNRKHVQPNKLRNSHSSNLCHNNKHRDINHSANKRKIHRIKIEKGLMSTKLADKLIHKLNYDIKAQSFKDNNGNIINNNILINSFNF
jgi:hypothetical protein